MYKCKECNYETKSCRGLGAHVINTHRKINRKKLKIKRIAKIFVCERCKQEFTKEVKANYAKDKNYCSIFCARSRGVRSEEFKQSVRKKLTKVFLEQTCCKNCQKIFTHKRKRIFCSKQCAAKFNSKDFEIRQKISQANKGKTGGWRNFGGNGVKGIYKNFLYQSSWELAYIIYNIKNNVRFTRCIDSFEYVYNNKKSRYTPDFYLPDENMYIEIKGFFTDKVLQKISAVENIKVIDKEGIKKYLSYCKTDIDFINILREWQSGRMRLSSKQELS